MAEAAVWAAGVLYGLALLIAAGIAGAVALGEWASRCPRPVGRHRARPRVIEGELVSEETVPLPVGRWGR